MTCKPWTGDQLRPLECWLAHIVSGRISTALATQHKPVTWSVGLINELLAFALAAWLNADHKIYC